MLDVKIDIVPFGMESGRRTIGRLKIALQGVRNIEGMEKGRYECELVLTDREGTDARTRASVEHWRDEGASRLVALALEACNGRSRV